MKKKTKTMRKGLSVFLAFLIAAQILPLQVLAESVTDAIAHQQFIEDVLNNPTSEDNTSDAEILYEVEEKRDEYTKVYKKSDGSYTAIMTEEPLHYLYNGEWEEINNSMSLNGNLYTNLDNLFNVELPKSINSNENLTVEKDGYELSFSVDEIKESSAIVENDIVVSDTNIPVADEAISQTQSSVTYNDVAENTDLQYIVTPNSIKENIIVSNKESVKDTYTFTFETNGLDTEKLDDGSVVFKDENNEIKFRIPRPVMTDSGLAYSYDINVVLIENTNGTITLEYSPSSEWINNSDRVYPITIDPAIHVENEGASWVEDTYVAYDSSNSNMQNINHYNDSVGTVASNTDNDGKQIHSEVYTKINIEALKSLGNNIVFTEVQYLFAGISVDGKALAKIINTPTDLATVTYATKPSLDNEVIDYYTSPYSLNGEIEPSFHHFNITKPLNEWYNGADNNGFAIVSGNEEYIGLLFLNSTPTGSSTTYTTYIVMDYVDMGGYNENLNYHSQTVGRAGTGYVNDFTQQLSVIRDDLSIDGNIMPVTVGMIYNSATYDKMKSLNDGTMMAYGNGWTPNYLRAFVRMSDNNQIVYYTESGSEIDYTYSVINGEVVFEETYSDFYGEHGYEIEYFPSMGGQPEYIVITRPDGLEERFNEWGLLTSVTNSDYPSQKINIVYDSMFRIDYITDGIGRKYDYFYENSTNLLSKIKCYSADSEEIKAGSTTSPLEVNYNYDEKENLTSVTFPDDKSASYTYDENGNITAIVNINGNRIVYEYDENGKITNITEQTLDGANYINGSFITYERLSPTQIKLIDGIGNYEIYQFNNNGTLLYTIDSNGNYAINNVEGSTNNSFFISSNDYRINAENLLLNSSFEKEYSTLNTSRAKYWENSNFAFKRTASNNACLGDYVYTMSQDIETTVYQKQTVNVLSGGKYTFSAYVKSDEKNEEKDEEKDVVRLYLNISSYNSSNTKTTSKSIPVETTYGEWQRYWVALDIPEDTVKIVVEFGFKNSQGTYYIDNVQLEQTSSVNKYNYIENGGFIKDIEGWETESSYSIVDTRITDSNEKAVSFNGNIDGANVIYQTVRIDGKKGSVFTIGGWLKSCFVKSSTKNAIIHNIINDYHNNDKIFNFTNDRLAQIEVAYRYDVENDDGTTETLTETIVVPFYQNVDDWQFVAEDFILKGDCKDVLVAIRYSKNANSPLIANIELTKNEDEFIFGDENTSEEENSDEDNPNTATGTCNCANCEEPNCKCSCRSEALCYCVQCFNKYNTTEKDEFGNIISNTGFDGIEKIETLTRFTDNGNYLFSETDADGNTIEYTYDQLNGLLLAIRDAKNSITSYTYNDSNSLTKISNKYTNLKTGETIEIFGEYKYENDKIVSVTHNGFSYNFSYNEQGHLNQVSIGQQPILSYEYGTGPFSGRINRTIYHHSDTDKTITEYLYDETGNIIEILINGETKFLYTYDALGNLTEILKTDCRRVIYTGYRTDILDINDNYVYSVDATENYKIVETIKGVTCTTTSKKNGITGAFTKGEYEDYKNIKIGNISIDINLQKDWFGRYKVNTVSAENTIAENAEKLSTSIVTEYQYPHSYEDNKTSHRVQSYVNYLYDGLYNAEGKLNEIYGFTYDYDENGNITAEYEYDYTKENKKGTIRYEYNYDGLNQLVEYKDYVSNPGCVYTHQYRYDSAGNIISKETYLGDGETLGEPTSTTNYLYDSTWKDKLESYDDETITYDGIGNPTSLMGAELRWTGKQLDSYTFTMKDDNGVDITKCIQYNYDESGLIHEKYVYVNNQLSEKYNYTWLYGKLVNQIYTKYESDGSKSAYTFKFLYDLYNTPYGVIVNNSITYLYVKNLQGDVVKIINNFDETVLTYTYDAWGKPNQNTHNVIEDDLIENIIKGFSTIYRGYYYDYDSGLYFIKGRYYSPEIGRFINANSTDKLSYANSTLDFNLYCYCENNPITYAVKDINSEYLNAIHSNYLYNKELAKEINGYIYNQHAGDVSKMRLGFNTIHRDGCGIIATYNALVMLGNNNSKNPIKLYDVIQEFEINGVHLYGLFGATPAGVVKFFKTRGYTVIVSYDVENFDDYAEDSKANILFYSHDGGGHYIALKRDGSEYQCYNVTCSVSESEKINGNIKDALNSMNCKGRILISIS